MQMKLHLPWQVTADFLQDLPNLCSRPANDEIVTFDQVMFTACHVLVKLHVTGIVINN